MPGVFMPYPRSTVPSARVMVWPLKLIVPLCMRLVIVQSPVSVQVQPDPMVTTALSETAAPPSALSTMLIVPVKLLPFWSVRSSVEIVSTRILPSSVCASAVN